MNEYKQAWLFNENTVVLDKSQIHNAKDNEFRRVTLFLPVDEKEIPKEPNIYTDTRNDLYCNGTDRGTREVNCWMCPNPSCSEYIADCSDDIEHMPLCCPSCGQKLDWSVEE